MVGNPLDVVRTHPMSWPQVRAVIIGICINAVDGYDVLAISLAAPGIAKDWGIDRAQLGLVLSMELMGMAVGSLLFGRLGDRIGRRPMLAGCLAIIACAMLLCATAQSPVILAIWRLATGIGIGGMLPSLTAMVTEASNDGKRDLSVVGLSAGYAGGAFLGGTCAAYLLSIFDWRSIFILGAFMTLVVVGMVLLWVPESVAFLDRHRPANALAKINKTLRLFGIAGLEALPPPQQELPKPRLSALFQRNIIVNTLATAAAFFMHMSTFYFAVKWIPKIVADLGHTPSIAATTVGWVNAGGVVGAIFAGLLAVRIGIKRVTLSVMLLTAAMVFVFGQSGDDLAWLSIVALVLGFVSYAGVGGLYAVMARSFPVHLRATGLGFAMGIGRGASALSPMVAGYLFQSGFSLPVVALVMGTGSIIAALLLWPVHSKE